MNTNSKAKKNVLFLLFMTIIGAIFTLIYLSLKGNENQVYNDIVVEFTSIFSSNKSAERNLIFILCFLGIFSYSVYYFLGQRNKKTAEIVYENVAGEEQKAKEFLCALLAMTVVYLLIFGATYHILVAGMAFSIFLYIVDRALVVPGICLYFMSIYTYIALYRGYVFLGGANPGNNMTAVIVAFLLLSLSVFCSNKKKFLLRLGLLENIIIPFALLMYTSNRYKKGEKIFEINISNNALNIVWAIIIVFVLIAMIKIVKKWNTVESIEQVITMGTCITIMAFNRFDGTGAIMSTDLHHPFENIIGYSQVVQLGRIPFKEYIPVSGMYSLIQGAIFDWFGDGGTFANYFITNNLFYLFVIIPIVWLLMKHIDNAYVLLISLLFYVDSYNRLVFILPIMLLLTWPKLIEQENIWLMTWLMTSLFQGLYYPLYGTATCVAFFPLMIWIIKKYVKSGKLKKDIKTIRFWLGWGMCLILALLCTSFLIGTLKHMLAMSSQSVLSDGISRFGQTVPEWFFGYLGEKNQIIRLSLYYIFTFVIPPLFVWVAYALAMDCYDASIENARVRLRNFERGSVVISAVIMPIISYSYTVIRYDMDSIYARSSCILFLGAVLILVFSWKYMNDTKIRMIIVLFCVSIPAVVNTVGIYTTESHSKLEAYYTVPDDYVYVQNDHVKKLGTGFIRSDIYEIITSYDKKFTKKNREVSYYGDPPYFGYYYLLNLKGGGAMEIAGTVKSYLAAEEAVDTVRKNRSIVGATFTPFCNYYFYHWLLASGEYYWDADQWEFIPNDGKYSKGEILEQNKNNGIAFWNMDLEKTASSWGLSMESLNKLFSEPELQYTVERSNNAVIVNFEEPFDGDISDFAYLEFTNMCTNYNYTLYNLSGEIEQPESKYSKLLMRKNYNPGMTVQIKWYDENNEEHAMIAKMSQGKLLFPIGAGTKWLFNNHSSISIHVLQDDVEIETPELAQIRFLKIREVE